MNKGELTTIQFEAITWAMFGIENEKEHLKYLLMNVENTETEKFLRDQLKRRQLHWEALNDLIFSEAELAK